MILTLVDDGAVWSKAAAWNIHRFAPSTAHQENNLCEFRGMILATLIITQVNVDQSTSYASNREPKAQLNVLSFF